MALVLLLCLQVMHLVHGVVAGVVLGLLAQQLQQGKPWAHEAAELGQLAKGVHVVHQGHQEEAEEVVWQRFPVVVVLVRFLDLLMVLCQGVAHAAVEQRDYLATLR